MRFFGNREPFVRVCLVAVTHHFAIFPSYIFPPFIRFCHIELSKITTIGKRFCGSCGPVLKFLDLTNFEPVMFFFENSYFRGVLGVYSCEVLRPSISLFCHLNGGKIHPINGRSRSKNFISKNKPLALKIVRCIYASLLCILTWVFLSDFPMPAEKIRQNHLRFT